MSWFAKPWATEETTANHPAFLLLRITDAIIPTFVVIFSDGTIGGNRMSTDTQVTKALETPSTTVVPPATTKK